MNRLTFLFFAFVLWLGPINAQAPRHWTSGDIYHAIEKLNFLGSALYVAAHPDDENTRLIAYLSNEVKANTAYLSLTRGDGGQNLIGPELQELLGVIRTQELLAARRIDGGHQRFTRANDFGYSKTPEETLDIWNKEAVLSDVVWALRNWRPDIIINRFNHDPSRRTHGHHTASAQLSFEAFDLAGDPKAFPQQLSYTKTWQPRRLFFNTSWWFYGSREKFAQADKSRMLSVDVGVFYPLKGQSNTEIAALSRSQHKCQGFGSAGSRGSQMEYLELLKGDLPGDKEDLFAGINTSWSRVPGGAPIGDRIKAVAGQFDFADPAASVPALLEVHAMIQALEDGYWKRVKEKEVKDIIAACLGLFLEPVADDHSATPGQSVQLSLEATNRSKVPASLQSISILPLGVDTSLRVELPPNQEIKIFREVAIPKDFPYSNPYWLNEEWALGMYTVPDQQMRGQPETVRPLRVHFSIGILGRSLHYKRDVVYKSTDPVKGEVYRPFEITPPVFANLDDAVYVYSEQQAKKVRVKIKAGAPYISGALTLARPDDWQLRPESQDFSLEQKGEEITLTFELTPPAGESEGQLSPVVQIDGRHYHKEVVQIEYDHIPAQTVMRDAVSKVVKLNLQKEGSRIGYIMGAGDAVPASLEQIGYQVDILDPAGISPDLLDSYDALILGIRAYNTVDRLAFLQKDLLGYVERGGTMIVQYNTSHRLKLPMDQIAPFHLQLSRDRVSSETAPIRILEPEHPVLNFPNKITGKDFDGWIQERGLYFPDEWGAPFEAILSSNDPGEPPTDGGLLVAKYGKGYYVYSGISWFRQLPAGVPGAYRIFANMISLGQGEAP